MINNSFGAIQIVCTHVSSNFLTSSLCSLQAFRELHWKCARFSEFLWLKNIYICGSKWLKKSTAVRLVRTFLKFRGQTKSVTSVSLWLPSDQVQTDLSFCLVESMMESKVLLRSVLECHVTCLVYFRCRDVCVLLLLNLFKFWRKNSSRFIFFCWVASQFLNLLFSCSTSSFCDLTCHRQGNIWTVFSFRLLLSLIKLFSK